MMTNTETKTESLPLAEAVVYLACGVATGMIVGAIVTLLAMRGGK